ncbi:MAG TPA: glycosyltransferase family 2 protein [Verrucomicrobiae bacterium]|nr:glycosyltransferase family 2 protein [Verrucomicrobiae bacterium]
MNSRVAILESLAPLRTPRIAAVLPCYRVTKEILGVLARIGPEVERVYCVDDACPDACGRFIEERCQDPRVRVLRHDRNRGVGGATLAGFRQALEDGAEIIVKIDGDGQMDPALLPRLVAPIVAGRADYTKGNRFINLETVHSMPAVRLLGNAGLSFISKLSSGYWNIFDPTNGFLAVHATVLRELPLHKIHERYFFESDFIFRLNTVGAVIEDVPMTATYGEETSHLRVSRVLLPFLLLHCRNALKRIIYNHYLRDFSAASVELLAGSAALLFGLIFGAVRWWGSIQSDIPVTAGTVMLAGLPTLLGVQLLLSFLSYDIQSVPRIPLHLRLLPFVPPHFRPGDEVSAADPRAGSVSF